MGGGRGGGHDARTSSSVHTTAKDGNVSFTTFVIIITKMWFVKVVDALPLLGGCFREGCVQLLQLVCQDASSGT